MSSSISGSEAADRRWRSFAPVFVATALFVFATLLGLVAGLDPYDTGRFALFRQAGVAQQGPRTADASRGRDARFNAAIFGNSHIQLIRPETLDEQSGLRFVSLTVPGTFPKEQLTLIDWFLRYHLDPEAIVVGLDDTWCVDRLDNALPFPFWLYDRDRLTYLKGLARYSTLERVPGAIGLLLGSTKAARPDGYWNYEDDYRRLSHTGPDHDRFTGARPTVSINPQGVFPAADRLGALLAAMPQSTRVVLVWPPVYVSAQPQPGSPGEMTMRACHEVAANVAARHAQTAILDWAIDRAETRNAANFFDPTHYRENLAGILARDIAASLSAMGALSYPDSESMRAP